jgi:esterase/lipase superfamily enzyme
VYLIHRKSAVKIIILLVIGLNILSACAGKPEIVDTGAKTESVVAVFYGTDRDRSDSDNPARIYGLERGDLEYGVVQVSLDDSKTRLKTVTPMSSELFLIELDKNLEKSDINSALIFVHGYNRSFNQTGKLIAEFLANTKFHGVPIIWSWPSSRNPAGYLEDQTNVRWSQPHFLEFLRTVIENSAAETVHLVGHSMGAWGLTHVVLQELLPGGIDRSKIGEFVLLAPDIDLEIFKRDLAPKLAASGLSTTLYTSSNDKAMASARALNGYPRAGDSSMGPVIVPGIETIDATEANNSILGHSYFEESEVVSKDLVQLLNERKPASARSGLKAVSSPEGIFWRIIVDH